MEQERIYEMLKNKTYISNMVQGRMVKISYKSKKYLRQLPENWEIAEEMHEPIIDPETFQKVQMLVNSRKHTRSWTYDILLKSLISCYEYGYPHGGAQPQKCRQRGFSFLCLLKLPTLH